MHPLLFTRDQLQFHCTILSEFNVIRKVQLFHLETVQFAFSKLAQSPALQSQTFLWGGLCICKSESQWLITEILSSTQWTSNRGMCPLGIDLEMMVSLESPNSQHCFGLHNLWFILKKLIGQLFQPHDCLLVLRDSSFSLWAFKRSLIQMLMQSILC